jgi:ribosome maturation factor RimP
VTHEDCAEFSRELGTILDVEDAIPGGQYLLEVSSPGLDRKLVKRSDFERFSGSKIKIMTREPLNGNRHFEGRLRTSGHDRIILELELRRKDRKRNRHKGEVEHRDPEQAIEIEMSNIERARLVPEI